MADLRKESNKIIDEQENIAKEIVRLKQNHNVKLVREEGYLTVENAKDNKETKNLCKKLDDLDAQFDHCCYRMDKIESKSNYTYSQIANRDRGSARFFDIFENHKAKHLNNIEKYKKLTKG